MLKPYHTIRTVPHYREFVKTHQPAEAIPDGIYPVARALWNSVAGLVTTEDYGYKLDLHIAEVRPTHFEESRQPHTLLGPIGPAITEEATQDGLPSLVVSAVHAHPRVPFPALEKDQQFVSYRLSLPHEGEATDSLGLPDRSLVSQIHIAPHLAACILWELGVFIPASLSDDPTHDEPVTPSND